VLTVSEGITCYYLGVLKEYLEREHLLEYLYEIIEERAILDNLEKAVKDVDFFRTKTWNSIFELGLYRILNYVLVRALKPKVFLETGILHGLTTDYILEGFSKNGSGRLISIDYPSYFESGPSNKDGYNDTLPPNKEPGWVVNPKNRPYWQMILGKSLEEMPSILKENQIDIFLHDSEHTYENMTGEFNLVWEYIKKGGILICDNIDNNDAFSDFCKKVDRKPLLFPEGINVSSFKNDFRFGLIKK